MNVSGFLLEPHLEQFLDAFEEMARGCVPVFHVDDGAVGGVVLGRGRDFGLGRTHDYANDVFPVARSYYRTDQAN